MPITHPVLGNFIGASYAGKQCIKIVFEGKTIWSGDTQAPYTDPGYYDADGSGSSDLFLAYGEIKNPRDPSRGSISTNGPTIYIASVISTSLIQTSPGETIILDNNSDRGHVTGPGPSIYLNNELIVSELYL